MQLQIADSLRFARESTYSTTIPGSSPNSQRIQRGRLAGNHKEKQTRQHNGVDLLRRSQERLLCRFLQPKLEDDALLILL
jgi:hypothetical protein